MSQSGSHSVCLSVCLERRSEEVMRDQDGPGVGMCLSLDGDDEFEESCSQRVSSE